MEKYLCWYAHKKPCVPHDTMIKMMVGLNSNANNMHKVIDDNSNSYRSMIMDAMRMTKDDVSQSLIIYKELNIDSTMFLNLLRYSNKPSWDSCTNHNKLPIIT